MLLRMQGDASDDFEWDHAASRMVSRHLQASDERAVEHLARRATQGDAFLEGFRRLAGHHDDDASPWLKQTMALENPAGGLLCAGLHAQTADVLHEHRIELGLLFDPEIAASALAPVFLEALERAAFARWGGDRRQRPAGDPLADAPAWLRITVLDDAALAKVAELRGFELAHAEDDMTRLRRAGDAMDAPLAAWDGAHASAFFKAYEAAFRERPGFPAWSEQRWLLFATDYDAFRPELSHVLLEGGDPLAFRIVAIEEAPEGRRACVVQLGVAPAARGRGLGRALLTDLDARLPEDVRAIELSVGTNNPAARALFERDGFEVLRRRRVYRKPLVR